MKQLDMEFKSENGKTKHMRLNYAAQTLEETTVKTAMQTIADLKMFEVEACNPYALPIKAQYVERTVTPIFGGEDADKAEDAE
ncbi:DUF2922 domain-containing protein [Loigolactobacillus zhaoyuanensis]|uniref:DUF2922 domain-containing protein n=1 Tax=Loigolactobacillus zhaoyuanensis TaxID=2486017 RepID=A0ABW8UHK1_9LACO